MSEFAGRTSQDDVNSRPAEVIDPAHLAAVMEGLAQADRGQYASDEEFEDIFRSVGL